MVNFMVLGDFLNIKICFTEDSFSRYFIDTKEKDLQKKEEKEREKEKKERKRERRRGGKRKKKEERKGEKEREKEKKDCVMGLFDVNLSKNIK
jgi:hypothetical protein